MLWPGGCSQELASEQSLSCGSHRAGALELKGTVREKQASMW